MHASHTPAPAGRALPTALSHALAGTFACAGDLRPGSNGSRGGRVDGQLRQLSCLLGALAPASEAVLRSLGPTVEEWVAWCLSPSTTSALFFTTEQLTLVLGKGLL